MNVTSVDITQQTPNRETRRLHVTGVQPSDKIVSAKFRFTGNPVELRAWQSMRDVVAELMDRQSWVDRVHKVNERNIEVFFIREPCVEEFIRVTESIQNVMDASWGEGLIEIRAEAFLDHLKSTPEENETDEVTEKTDWRVLVSRIIDSAHASTEVCIQLGDVVVGLEAENKTLTKKLVAEYGWQKRVSSLSQENANLKSKLERIGAAMGGDVDAD